MMNQETVWRASNKQSFEWYYSFNTIFRILQSVHKLGKSISHISFPMLNRKYRNRQRPAKLCIYVFKSFYSLGKFLRTLPKNKILLHMSVSLASTPLAICIDLGIMFDNINTLTTWDIGNSMVFDGFSDLFHIAKGGCLWDFNSTSTWKISFYVKSDETGPQKKTSWS